MGPTVWGPIKILGTGRILRLSQNSRRAAIFHSIQLRNFEGKRDFEIFNSLLSTLDADIREFFFCLDNLNII